MSQPVIPSGRDPRIDVLRGLALLMIFVDHIPADLLNRATLHNFGFCDAAEVFVFLAGFSSMLAYGKAFEREGVLRGLARIAGRCFRIYLFQIGLLAATFGIALVWTSVYHFSPAIVARVLGAPLSAIAHGLTLQALPKYVDILPLYVLLLAGFPLIYFGLRRHAWLTLAASAALWGVANLDHDLNMTNWVDGRGWFFDPFAWQLLFTIGALMAQGLARRGGSLPRSRWLVGLCLAYLIGAALQATPWADCPLPNLQLFAMAPTDKSYLGWPRILDILALVYLCFSSDRLIAITRHRLLRPMQLYGRHSLEVFSVGCILALFGRLAFRVDGAGPAMQLLVNVVGIGAMWGVAAWLEHGRQQRRGGGADVPARPAPLAGGLQPVRVPARR